MGNDHLDPDLLWMKHKIVAKEIMEIFVKIDLKSSDIASIIGILEGLILRSYYYAHGTSAKDLCEKVILLSKERIIREIMNLPEGDLKDIKDTAEQEK